MSARPIARGALAALVAGALAGCSTGTDSGSPDPVAASTSARTPDATHGSEDGPTPLEPGPHAMAFFAATDDAPHAELQVPAGWGLDRIVLVTGQDLDPHLRRIELSTVATVAPDPCEASSAPVGPEVADLMASLAAQQTVEPARPRPVSLDGHDGQVLEVRVPLDVDVTGCDHGGTLVPWMSPGGSYVTVFPGWTYRVWAVDVDGERLVVLAAHGPDATATERAELADMVETLRFVDAPTS